MWYNWNRLHFQVSCSSNVIYFQVKNNWNVLHFEEWHNWNVIYFQVKKQLKCDSFPGVMQINRDSFSGVLRVKHSSLSSLIFSETWFIFRYANLWNVVRYQVQYNWRTGSLWPLTSSLMTSLPQLTTSCESWKSTRYAFDCPGRTRLYCTFFVCLDRQHTCLYMHQAELLRPRFTLEQWHIGERR